MRRDGGRSQFLLSAYVGEESLHGGEQLVRICFPKACCSGVVLGLGRLGRRPAAQVNPLDEQGAAQVMVVRLGYLGSAPAAALRRVV